MWLGHVIKLSIKWTTSSDGAKDLREEQATEANSTPSASAGGKLQACLELLHAVPDPSLILT